MLKQEQINAMSTDDRLRAIEQLWDSLPNPNAEVDSPGWHEGVLRSRRERAESGEARLLTLSQLRQRLSDSVS
ncbi:MAG: addiction module protein [Planctomycetota bacterium]